MRTRIALTSCCLLTLAAFAPQAMAQDDAARPRALQQVAHFDHEVTGVTVSKENRIFVNFPRWTEDSPISVAEVMKDGSLKAYPDESWNAWRNVKFGKLSPKDHFICVQSVVVDGRNNLWVLDPAAPATAKTVKDGPKLVKIDLGTNQVAKVIPFDQTVAPPSSYLNDVRFAPDGKTAYITDSGASGAIVVVDLERGTARRLLDGDPSTQIEKDVEIKTDGKPLKMPDGRGPMFAADGIALTPDGKMLYWQATTGRTIYRIPTEALTDGSLAPKDVAAKVEKVTTGEPSDGYWMDGKGRLYISAMQENAVKMWDGKSFTTVAQDPKLRWPDTFAQGPDGMIYVTASHIMDNAQYKPGAPIALKTELYRFQPP